MLSVAFSVRRTRRLSGHACYPGGRQKPFAVLAAIDSTPKLGPIEGALAGWPLPRTGPAIA
jgi:hypothetical protein